jgi:hypothetical protein
VVLDRVTVTPKDFAAFELRLDGARVEAAVPSEGRVSDIQVEGSISFGARVEDLRYVARKPIVAYGGLVRILQGASITSGRWNGHSVFGNVVMDDDAGRYQGENKPPAVVAGPVPLPCSALSLEDSDEVVEPHKANHAQVESDRRTVLWRARDGQARVILNAKPNTKSATVVVVDVYTSRGGRLKFRQLDESEKWVRVERVGAFVRVVGWTTRSQLQRVKSVLAASDEDRTTGYDGTHVRNQQPIFVGPDSTNPKQHYEGTAVIMAGTTVYRDDKRGEPWATVTKEDAFDIKLVNGEPWAALTRIPGVNTPDGGVLGFVPVSAIKLLGAAR